MSPRPLEELLENIIKRYKKATRKKKSIILDEFCANHKCHRKSAIRIFSRFKNPKPAKKIFVERDVAKRDTLFQNHYSRVC